MKNVSILSSVLVALLACAGSNKNAATADTLKVNKVLSATEQARLTPDQVLASLKQGNQAFTQANPELVRDAAKGQFPKAVILSCLDSRVPVEEVFQRNIGDVFVARVAGNIVNPDILGSMEFACKVSGAKLIVVLGHGSCGAIKAAIDDVELGNITGLLGKIKPAVAQAKVGFEGEAKSSNPEFVEKVCQTNVAVMVNEIRQKSPILKEMEGNGEIKIVGGIYNMESGVVDFLENI